MSVLCWITSDEEIATTARWAFRFAAARDEDLILLHAEFTRAATEVLSFVSDENLPEDENVLNLAKLAIDEIRVPSSDEKNQLAVTLKRLKSVDVVGEIKKIIAEDSVSLLILPKNSKVEKLPRKSQAIRELFNESPCETLVIRFGESNGEQCKNILVPVAGGANASVALKIGHKLLNDSEDDLLVPFRVAPHGNQVLQSVGQKSLDDLQAKAGLKDSPIVKAKLALHNQVEKAILKEAQAGYDLVLLGDSGVGSVRKRIFGTIPSHLLESDHSYAVGVLRAAKPFHSRMRSRIEDWLDLTVPQLERNDRISLVEHLTDGSRWNFDFLALMGLSTAIAGLGLLQNSAAVVIGAMLVAPLMVPLLGAGLALVQENRKLILSSSRSIIYGFLLALTISLLLGLLVPGASLTDEILARGGPTLLDMAVAILSGMAAAYCVARPNLSAALPGVAIAAALVPPIATVGICISIGATDTAFGASILFVTNVIFIILGAIISFYAGGIRGAEGESHSQRWVQRTTLALLLCAAVLSVPLGSMLFSKITSITPVKENTLPLALRAELDSTLASHGAKLIRATPSSKLIEIFLESPKTPDRELVEGVYQLLHTKVENGTKFKINTSIVIEEEIIVPTKQTETNRKPK